MTVAEVTEKLEAMSDSDKLLVIEIATKLLKKSLPDDRKGKIAEMRQNLKKSAEIMRDEYLNNKELTTVTDALASEDFLDA